MSIRSELKIGSRILVTSPQRDQETPYVSRLEDLRPEGIAIAVPLWRGHPLLLRAGERVFLQVLIGEALLEFDSVVIGRAESRIRLFVTTYPAVWRRVQRRADVRLEVTLRVEGHVETGRVPEELHFQTYDLSAGGLGLWSRRRLPLGTRAALYFRVVQKRSARYIRARGEVVRVTGPESGEYRIGVRFVEIKKSDQDFIVGFIFQRLIERKHED